MMTALLAAVVFFLFNGVLLTDRVFFLDDIQAQYYPWRHFQYQMGQEGKLYLWNPYLYSGCPFQADIQTALFYPGNWLFFFIPPAKGIVYFVVLHNFLAGLFMYIFLRHLDLKPLPALCGAVLYNLTGFALLHTIHTNMLSSFALIPVVLLLIHRTIKDPTPILAIFTGLAAGIHILSGSPQVTFMLFMIAIIYIASHLDHKKIISSKNVKLTSLFAIAAVIAVLISAVQLMPSLEYFKLTPRSTSVTMSQAGRGSLGFDEALMSVIPDFLGHPVTSPPFEGDFFYWEACFFVGVLPLFLSIPFLALIPLERKKTGKIFLVTAAVGIFLALGEHNPLFPVLLKIPFVGSFRVPIRYMVLTLPALCYFTASAVEELANLKKGTGEAALASAYYAAGLLPMFAMILFLVALDGHPLRSGEFFFILTGVGGATLVFTRIYGWTKKSHFKAFAFILLIISCFSFGITVNPTVPKKYYSAKKGFFEKVANKTPPVRVYYCPPEHPRDTINMPMAAGVSNVVGYNPQAISWYLEYLIYSDYSRTLDRPIRRVLTSQANMFSLEKPRSKMIRMLDVSWIYKFSKEKMGLRVSAEPVENSSPRVFMVEKHEVIEEKEKLLEKLDSDDFDPLSVVLFQENPQVAKNNNIGQIVSRGTVGEASITGFTPDEVRVKFDAKTPAWLVLSEIYYPGWRAEVDGRSRKVYRANYIFRAVRVFPGEREVMFSFKPSSYRRGALVSSATLILCAGFLACFLLKRDSK